MPLFRHAACFVVVFIGLLLSGCMRQRLTAYTEYISHKNFASYYIGTPDPCQEYPPVGQRLRITWSLPRAYLNHDDLRIQLTVRFWNRSEIDKVVKINQSAGSFTYSILNDIFFDLGGIQTYQILLMGGDEVLEEWYHQTWNPLIRVDMLE